MDVSVNSCRTVYGSNPSAGEPGISFKVTSCSSSRAQVVVYDDDSCRSTLRSFELGIGSCTANPFHFSSSLLVTTCGSVTSSGGGGGGGGTSGGGGSNNEASDAPKPKPSCFTGDGMVRLRSGDAVPYARLAVGDEVLSVDADGALTFTTVFRVTHAAPADRETFTRIVTTSGHSLELTPNHMLHVGTWVGDICLPSVEEIPTGPVVVVAVVVVPAAVHVPFPKHAPALTRVCVLMPPPGSCCRLDLLRFARDIHVGDTVFVVTAAGTSGASPSDGLSLTAATVATMETVQRTGVYNVHTLNGNIVVNDVAASLFTDETTWGPATRSWAPLWYHAVHAVSALAG